MLLFAFAVAVGFAVVHLFEAVHRRTVVAGLLAAALGGWLGPGTIGTNDALLGISAAEPLKVREHGLPKGHLVGGTARAMAPSRSAYDQKLLGLGFAEQIHIDTQVADVAPLGKTRPDDADGTGALGGITLTHIHHPLGGFAVQSQNGEVLFVKTDHVVDLCAARGHGDTVILARSVLHEHAAVTPHSVHVFPRDNGVADGHVVFLGGCVQLAPCLIFQRLILRILHLLACDQPQDLLLGHAVGHEFRDAGVGEFVQCPVDLAFGRLGKHYPCFLVRNHRDFQHSGCHERYSS